MRNAAARAVAALLPLVMTTVGRCDEAEAIKALEAKGAVIELVDDPETGKPVQLVALGAELKVEDLKLLRELKSLRGVTVNKAFTDASLKELKDFMVVPTRR